MKIDRREFVSCASAGAALSVFAAFTPVRVFALSEDAAVAHVRATIDEILPLAQRPGSAESKAPELLEIMRRRVAMAQIARFVAGFAWRSMSNDQRDQFVGAVSRSLSVVYARRFQEYFGDIQSGESYTLGGVIDAGRKGMLVRTLIARHAVAPILVEWLVTDRPGQTIIADIVFDGVSPMRKEFCEILLAGEAAAQIDWCQLVPYD